MRYLFTYRFSWVDMAGTFGFLAAQSFGNWLLAAACIVVAAIASLTGRKLLGFKKGEE